MPAISVFDILKIGVGPSSSHTLGPWRAAQRFIARCRELGIFDSIEAIQVSLYGSLAKTGRGHMTDVAVILGLSDVDPVTCDTDAIPEVVARMRTNCDLVLGGTRHIRFDPSQNILFDPVMSSLQHPNTMSLTAWLTGGDHTEVYYSLGGGFILKEGESENDPSSVDLPCPIVTASDLQDHCEREQLTIPEVVWQNERAWRSEKLIHEGLGAIWTTMKQCAYRGCHKEGTLPGGLNVVRRAAGINRILLPSDDSHDVDSWISRIREERPTFQDTLAWVSCFALAVNEENASFGRVVTAPTNGAAGVIPAVLLHYVCFCDGDYEGVERFLLTAAEIGSIIKKSATISAAMGGCQAEIGVSSAMAAAGLTQCLGGSPGQVVMAAEIALEHHLGMTCDPVGGLVQVPCIERNSMGAVKAITASTLALSSDPSQAKVSLDAVIKTMWDTALDMNTKYKETAEGGLALQIPLSLAEC